MQKQLYNILEKLIIKNNIQVNKEELKLQLTSHPSYPSLHALTGVLDHFSIPNLALRLVANQEILQQLPSSFIANVSEEQGEALIFAEKKKDSIKITNDNKESKTITKEEFLNTWNGILVVIEKDETVKETKEHPIKKVTNWLLSGLGLLLIGYLMFSSSNLFAKAHFLLSSIGLVISVFILKHELGLQSSTTNSFCNISEKTSCDAVLNSKGASVFGLFKLSDISIVVFSSYCLCWFLFFVSGTTSFLIMSIVTLLAFPFIVYSVYYQYNVVKKWCPLCLAIASVLMLQIGALVIGGFSLQAIEIDIQTLALFLISVIISISIWSFLKPILIKKETLEKMEVAHHKFKRNFSVFNVLLNEGDSLKSFTPIQGEINLGNKEAKIKLVLVTSPLCYYCKEAHRDMEQLLNRIGDKISLTIRFNANINNLNYGLYPIASRLLDIYNIKGENEILKVLNEVYDDAVNLEHWLENQSQELSKSYDSILETQSLWCKSNAINFTPAFYVNGKLFPKEYYRTDFIYFIDDLLEQQDTTMAENQAIAS